MVEPQASRFWQAAVRSGLLDEASLKAAWDGIPPEKRTHDAIDRRLARQIVNAGRLTLWQAQQMLAGRWQALRIDRYELRDVLGQGGMGRVYLARDVRLKRPVALKILSRERMNNPRAITRFSREAKVGAQLQHENLVRIYDEGEAHGVRFLVMEYIEGKTVGDLIAEHGRLPPAMAAGLGRQMALGLEHLHQKDLLHRDVNPMNVLVDRDGTAKLTDLGLAIDLGDMGDIVTRDGATVGTFDYISPEQARHSRSVGPGADLYSLGCTLFHMISGRVPFPTASLPEKLYAHQLTDPEPLTSLVPGVPEGLAAVVARLMKKSPEDRYPRAVDAARALEPFASGVASSEAIAAMPHVAPAPAPDGTTARAETAPTHDGSDPELNLPTVLPGGIAPPKTAAPTSASPATDFFPKIDLGPEPSLSEVRSGRPAGKAKPKSRTGSKSGDGEPAERRPRRPFPARQAAIAAGALAALGLLALAVVYRKKLPSLPGLTRSTSTEAPTPPRPGPTLPAPAPPPRSLAPIAIRHRDGTEEPQDSLREAIVRLGGSGGEILLRGKATHPVGDLKTPLRISDGHLVIRAEADARPDVAAIVASKVPWIEVSPRARLTLSGLSFRVTAFVPPDAKAGDLNPAPPVLILADGNVTLDRCAFSLSGDDRSPRAVVAQGNELRASGCHFEGFDRAIVAAMYPGADFRFAQCLFVRDVMADPSAGWAIKATRKNAPRNQARKIALDRCTVAGAGLIEADDFSADEPLSLSVSGTAVRATALILTSATVEALPKAILWTGKDNLYAPNGPAWIVTPPKAIDGLKGGPTELEAWMKLLPNDKGARAEPFKFAGSSTSEGHVPEDYAVVLGKDQPPAGADPAKVGPGTKP